MRVLVCGSRHGGIDDADLDRALDGVKVDVLIHGGAKGVDQFAGSWAEAHGIPVMVFPSNWSYHGTSAGPIRNRNMLKFGQPDLVVAFPGGVGTANMVKLARTWGGIQVVMAEVTL